MLSVLIFSVYMVSWSMASDFCAEPQCLTPLDFIIKHPAPNQGTFYRCSNSGSSIEAILEHCPTNTVFRFQQQACIEGNLNYDPCDTPALPPHTECSVPICRTPLEIEILHPADSRDSFYRCFQGAADRITCFDGSWFDFEQQGCVAPNEWTDVCKFDTATTTLRPPTACGMPPVCVQADLGLLHPVAEDSRSYYRCEPIAGGFAAMRHQCPSEFWFGFQQQGCVLSSDWLDPCV